MKRKLKSLVRDSLRFFLGKNLYTWLRFVLTHKYIPSFKEPRSMNEKIVHRKLYDDPHKFSKYASKYTVREYVEETIGEEYLVSLYKVKKTITFQDFKDLPQKFVVKTSNGGGGNNVLIVKNKAELDINSICHQFNGFLQRKAGVSSDELFYGLETPYVLFEEFLEPADGKLLEFKWHVFNTGGAEPELILQIDSDKMNRSERYSRSLFDESGKRLDFQWGKYPPVKDFKVPKHFELMKRIVSKLAEPFEYVRVDLHLSDEKIFFSELTFCNDSGFGVFTDKKYDFLLGKLWNEYESIGENS